MPRARPLRPPSSVSRIARDAAVAVLLGVFGAGGPGGGCVGAGRPPAEATPASPIPPATASGASRSAADGAAAPLPAGARTGAAAPSAGSTPPRVLPSIRAALDVVLAGRPRVLGIGEVHATTDAPTGRTVLKAFTDDVFPVLAPSTTDLVLETWRTDGACGAVEEEVVVQVDVDTKRPERTKSELELLVDAAVAANVRPHDLVFTCAEYATLQGPGGEVRYDALLALLADKLAEYALRGLETPGATVVLYGGAVHNDRVPIAGAEAYSYGARAAARGADAYVELDLYDVALVRGKRSLVDPAWEAALDLAGPDHVVLIERSPHSYVLLLPTAAAGG